MRNSLMEWMAQTAEAKPFLRWAGGKRPFLHRHGHELPSFSGSYLEPFLGSGAVFFYLSAREARPFQARLGDINQHLVRCFKEVQRQPGQVSEELEALQSSYSASSDGAAFYYSIREMHNSLHPITNAARFIFLNRTCWNGLYRVNRKGSFNVPFGAPKSDRVIPEKSAIVAASAALANTHLRTTSWKSTTALAKPGDFVFLDPPYFSDLAASKRSKYDRDGFSFAEHEEVARTLSDYKARGIDFLLTNSGEKEMIDLYSGFGLHVTTTQLPRAINSKIDDRGPVPELLVRPYPVE